MEGDATVIHVSKDQLRQIQYLIQQSMQGNHVLFDPTAVRDAFIDTRDPTDEQAYSVEHHLERLIQQPNLAAQRAYLEQLDTDTFRLLVRTYFNIIENNIYDNLEVKH